MPLTFFREKPSLIKEIVRSLSTDSTVDARASSSAKRGSPEIAVRKAEWPSIYRTPPASLDSYREDLWTLRRCDAFDEGDVEAERRVESCQQQAPGTSTRRATWEDFWTTKDSSPSVFRPPHPARSDDENSIEDLWSLRRCNAFDEDEDEM